MKNNLHRRKRERQEVRLRVLDAARELFLDGGEEAVTLRKVAAKIEYSATTIYLHFPSKEALIQELCAADFELFSRNLKQAERLADPMARLRKVSLTCADFGLQHPRHYRAMFMMPPGTGPAARPADRVVTPVSQPAADTPPAADAIYNFMYSAVFKAMAAGCFRSDHRDVHLIAQVIWSGLHGVISLHLGRARFPGVNWRATPTTVETMVDLLLIGLTGKVPFEEGG